MHACAGLDYLARGLNSGTVTCDTRKMARLRPPAVSIHDHRDVLRKLFEVDFFQQRSFDAVGGFQKFGGFHASFTLRTTHGSSQTLKNRD